ncbi:MAG: hypothetical protein WD942_00390 [Dehalococcoidia bacterium]
MAQVYLNRSAREALAALDFLRADAVLDALGELECDPHLGHQLRGRPTGLGSYRIGVYRIIDQLRDDRAARGGALRDRGSAHDIAPR